MNRESLISWTALALVPAFLPRDAKRATDRWADPARIAFRLGERELRAAGVRPSAAEALLAARGDLWKRARDEVASASRLGVRIVPRSDPDYPLELDLLEDPPPVLFWRGDLPAARPRVGLVGARRATAYGRRVAETLAAELATRGIEVVSGGARGIDTCAHRGAMLAGGRTVVVLGAGFRCLYPQENESLFARIAERGCVLTEFPLDAGPRPEHFPRRNRIIAALVAAAVVVEAAERSGSLITAGLAADLGKEVLAVPGPVHSSQSEGCHRLIRDGAALVRKAQDVVDELPPPYRDVLGPAPSEMQEAKPSGPDLARLTDDERIVWSLLADDPEAVHVDTLAERAPFAFSRLQVALFGLVVNGAVEQLAGGYYLPRSSAHSKN